MSTTLTRLTDSGFVLKHGDEAVAFDVGEFCDPALLAGFDLTAAVFSHGHSDHCDITKLPNPSIPLFAPTDVGATLLDAGASEVVPLLEGEPMSVASFKVTAYSVNHGAISKPILNFGLSITTPGNQTIWFAGDIRLDSEPRPEGVFDIYIIPIGGQYVFDATEAMSYLEGFDGSVIALGCHYDYDVTQAQQFVDLSTDRITTMVLDPGASIAIESKP